MADGSRKQIPPCHTTEHVIARAARNVEKEATYPSGWAAYASWNSPSEVVYFNGMSQFLLS